MTSGDSSEHALALEQCPECGYDLRALPSEHTCPECGFEYRADMFSITGAATRPRLTPIEAVSLVGLAVLLVALGIGRSAWAADVLIVGVFIVAALGAAWRWRIRRERGGDTTLLCTRDRIELKDTGMGSITRPWRHFAKVTVSPSPRRVLRRSRRADEVRRWRLRLLPHWYRFSGSTSFDVRIRVTAAQAAALERELGRRIGRR